MTAPTHQPRSSPDARVAPPAESPATGHALIMGGTAGTGLATALALAEGQVERITLVGRDPHRGEHACELVRRGSSGVHVQFERADGARADQTTRAIARSTATFGPLDVAVCAANAQVEPDLLHRLDRGALLAQITAVAAPAVLLTHAAVEAMRERGGAIVLVASDAGRTPTAGEATIGAGMAALSMLARVAAHEAKRWGIRVNVVSPSLLSGTTTADALLRGEFTRKVFEKAVRRADLGLATPADVAALIAYLASPAAARITGQVISVNGGISVA